MAVISKQLTRIEDFKDDAHVIEWLALNSDTSDSGEPIKMPGSADRCVQVLGNFGTAGSIRIEGSNVPSPTADSDYTVLTDPQGNALDITTARIEQITEVPLWIRPRYTAGSGASLNVRLLVRRPPT